tara:strand:+ start:21 stop:254 length:234 start_codon:yes stop_codon:yes gene_type:complete
MSLRCWKSVTASEVIICLNFKKIITTLPTKLRQEWFSDRSEDVSAEAVYDFCAGKKIFMMGPLLRGLVNQQRENKRY